jgi:hypothetical protein
MRDIDRNEPLRRIEIILAALIDDPKVALSPRLCVGYHAVDLVQLQRCWVARILHAHDELDRLTTLRLTRFTRHSACA